MQVRSISGFGSYKYGTIISISFFLLSTELLTRYRRHIMCARRYQAPKVLNDVWGSSGGRMVK